MQSLGSIASPFSNRADERIQFGFDVQRQHQLGGALEPVLKPSPLRAFVDFIKTR